MYVLCVHSVDVPSLKTRVSLGPALPLARPTRSISMRQPTSIGPNSRIQSQFGAPHRVTSPPRAHDLAYSSCGEPDARARRYLWPRPLAPETCGEPSAGVSASARHSEAHVIVVVASTANMRRARCIASINTHSTVAAQVKSGFAQWDSGGDAAERRSSGRAPESHLGGHFVFLLKSFFLSL